MSDIVNSVITGNGGEEWSRSLLRAADQLPLPFWCLDRQWECRGVNLAWQQLTGISAADAVGQGWETCLHPSDLSLYYQEREPAASEHAVSLVLRLRRAEGSYRLFYVTIVPQVDASRQWIGQLVHAVDIQDVPWRFLPNSNGGATPVSANTGRPPAAGTRPPSRPLSPEKALEVLLASEERLRWVIENIPVMVVALDDQFRIVAWNRECENVTGYRADEAIGNGELLNRLFHHAADRDWLLSQNGGQRKSWLEHECEITCRDLSLKTVTIKNVTRNVPIPGWRSWWVALDITDRKRSELALRESEARLRLAMRAGRMGIWDWNLRTDEVTFSEAQELQFGVPSTSFSGSYQDFLMRIHAEDRTRLSRVLNQAIERRKDYELEFRMVMPDGGQRWIQGKGQAIYEESGEAVRLLGLTMDITERKRLEAERLLMERRLQEAQKLETIGVLAGGIAHDFNNLLTGILGNASLARLASSPTADVQPHLRRIEEASLRAAELCKQMLAYAGKGSVNEQQLDLGELVRDSSVMLRSLVSDQAVINYRLAADLPAISADPSQVRQVLINLVVNASEALENRGGTIVVSTLAQRLRHEDFHQYSLVSNLMEGLYVVLEVSDNGCGMNAETMERVFDPFFSTKFAGRGLGLAAVQGIVRGHLGAIGLQSQPGVGTTVQILFPAVTKSPPLLPATPEPLRGTVLVVDDEETVLCVAASFLDSIGLKSLLAKDGDEALEFFRQNADQIDAVLLDFSMPKKDGVTTFRELRQVRQDVPVFLMSGYTEKEATLQFAGQDLAGFIQKPFNHQVLYQKLISVLKGPNR